MDASSKYDHAVQVYAAHLEAAGLARGQAETARLHLELAEPCNPALKVPMKEYALLQSQPILLLAEILFGGGREAPRRAITPELVLLAGSVALGRGESSARVLDVLQRVLERSLVRDR